MSSAAVAQNTVRVKSDKWVDSTGQWKETGPTYELTYDSNGELRESRWSIEPDLTYTDFVWLRWHYPIGYTRRRFPVFASLNVQRDGDSVKVPTKTRLKSGEEFQHITILNTKIIRIEDEEREFSYDEKKNLLSESCQCRDWRGVTYTKQDYSTSYFPDNHIRSVTVTEKAPAEALLEEQEYEYDSTGIVRARRLHHQSDGVAEMNYSFTGWFGFDPSLQPRIGPLLVGGQRWLSYSVETSIIEGKPYGIQPGITRYTRNYSPEGWMLLDSAHVVDQNTSQWLTTTYYPNGDFKENNYFSRSASGEVSHVLSSGDENEYDLLGRIFETRNWIKMGADQAKRYRTRMLFEYQPARVDRAIGDKTLVLYPNPAKTFCAVDEIYSNDQYQIIDPAGRVVLRDKVPNGGRIELPLPNGMYQLILNHQGGFETSGLVIAP